MTETSLWYSAGTVVCKGNKRGTVFYPYEDGKVIEDDTRRIIIRKSAKPVGWIVEIIKHDDNTYSGFKYRGCYQNQELNKKYRIDSLANQKWIDIENMRKREMSISKHIEGMTIGELKMWVNKAPANKRAITFYLQEMF